jgi:threonine dehydrogenase-like Zn-dependent dehydrogenase
VRAAIWEKPGDLRNGPALELMAAGAIDAESMLTHDFPLDGFADALANVREGRGVKSQVLPGA